MSSLVDKGLAKKSIKEVLLIARQILDIAIENQIVILNPFSRMKLPKGLPEEERKPLNDEQHKLIEKSWSTHRLGIANMIMLYAGLRRGEVLALTWKDVDLSKKIININKQVVFDKSGKPSITDPKTKNGFRKIPISNHLMNALHRIPLEKRKPSMLICPSAKGIIMTDCAYDRGWESWQNHLNIMAGGKSATRTNPRIQVLETFTAHQLRHTYASMLYDAGVDVKTAQIRLGHANIEITLKVYTDLSEQKQIASDDAYDRMLSEKFGNTDQSNNDAISVLSIAPPTKQEIDNVVYFPFASSK